MNFLKIFIFHIKFDKRFPSLFTYLVRPELNFSHIEESNYFYLLHAHRFHHILKLKSC